MRWASRAHGCHRRRREVAGVAPADLDRSGGTGSLIGRGRIFPERGAGPAVGRRARPDQRHPGSQPRCRERPGELAKARRLAEDAYWGEFEASDMETAVRKYLGFAKRAGWSGSFWRFARPYAKWPTNGGQPRNWPNCAASCSWIWRRSRASSMPRA